MSKETAQLILEARKVSHPMPSDDLWQALLDAVWILSPTDDKGDRVLPDMLHRTEAFNRVIKLLENDSLGSAEPCFHPKGFVQFRNGKPPLCPDCGLTLHRNRRY